LIAALIERGIAYQASDGSVYFSIERYRNAGRCYGQLLHLNFDEMRTGERIRTDEYEKEAVADFALWKARTPEDGDVFWPSPWGEGRPGWHIECSAMSMKLLGPSFDLHLGGEDLVFPHHEDEIAQSEGAGLQRPGEPFVRYWLHGAHLLVDGRKMAKSLGNFFTVRDLFARGYSGRELRSLLLTAHYRESFNFTLENLDGERTALARLDECLGKLKELADPGGNAAPDPALLDPIGNALDNDLNVAAARGILFDWVRDRNRRLAAGELTPREAAAGLAAWEVVDGILGIGRPPEVELPSEVLTLLEQRQAARKAKDFSRADALRGEIKERGWLIDDTPKGPRLRAV
jgi:cysteinyl-tRNA synthetase